jgi:hypothetical protein
MTTTHFYRLGLFAVLCVAALSASCQKPQTAQAPLAKKAKPSGNGHEHGLAETGPHSGPLAEWGDHEYHAEFTADRKAKSVTIYVLDAKGEKAPKLDPAKIANVTLSLTNVSPPVTIVLKHEPAKSDRRGIAFIGMHDALSSNPSLHGTLSGTVEGQPYVGEFSTSDGHSDAKKTGHTEEHPGGVHVAFAQGRYYAEAILHKGGELHLFLFGKDISRVVEADAQRVLVYVRKVGDPEFTTFELKPEPLAGDAKGTTSRFAGKIPTELVGKDLEVAIPALKLAGERYHLAFQRKEKAHGDGHVGEVAMPQSKGEVDEERKLYLTPGGLYIAEDIKANGNVTGSEKFKSFQARHDLKPKVGDKICPVTRTKANPECTWIIGGKKYEFCCPPCVEEFVRLAKEEPSAVKPPEAYVKQ